MLELRRCLTDERGNELSKLFHIDLKSLIRNGLMILYNRLPPINPAEFERENTRELWRIRELFFDHFICKARRKMMMAMFDLFIRMYDSDDAYAQPIEFLIEEIKRGKFIKSTSPHPAIWKN